MYTAGLFLFLVNKHISYIKNKKKRKENSYIRTIYI